MDEPVQGFDKAVLVLYRGGREVGTITFEPDGLGNGQPFVRLEDEPFSVERLRAAAQWMPLMERRAFRITAGIATLRLAPNPAAATPPR